MMVSSSFKVVPVVLGAIAFIITFITTSKSNVVVADTSTSTTSTIGETNRIIGGELAGPDEFPTFARPNRDGFALGCGSVLIHNDILLTAAHCAGNFQNSVMHIGGTNRFGIDAVESIKCIQEYPHPNFLNFFWWMFIGRNDIMLLKLESNATTTPSTWSTSRSTDPDSDTTVIATGHGFTSIEVGSSGVEDLRKAELRVDNFCFPQSLVLEIICTDSDLNDGQQQITNGCFGDSGGPLLNDDTDEIVGILSSVDPDCNSYSIFTRVSSYDDWIRQGICDLSSNPPADCDDNDDDNGGVLAGIFNFLFCL